ncbi:MAG: selenide, water dikinase SelD [Candidatus Lokiarchaeota archaeon]|nr:selenide, water dikinase SelD [Candidatus Lokiarchaeota archaeon]
MLPEDKTCSDQVGDDAVAQILSDNIAVVENVDVFTPIHDDPYIQGEIVACNASNDVFAMGVTTLVSLQAFLAYPKSMDEEVIVDVLRGMNDFMERLNSKVTGGQTIKNPCPVFGGVCLGVIHPKDIIYSKGARHGDIILLTKPLGIQPAMRSYRDLQDEKRTNLLAEFDEEELCKMQETAVKIMTQSNLEVARVMRSIGVHAATDVTGFGVLGHAQNVATLSEVQIEIESLPVIKGTLELAEFFGHKLAAGLGAETAGGMLVFLHPEKVDAFRYELREFGLPCWPIGHVTKDSDAPSASLAEGIEFIETDFP